MNASDWRPHQANTLRGFFSLHLASGLVLHGCTLHESGQSRWIGLPGTPQLDADGRQRCDVAGKKLWSPVVAIPDQEVRQRFRLEALAAVDRLLAESRP